VIQAIYESAKTGRTITALTSPLRAATVGSGAQTSPTVAALK